MHGQKNKLRVLVTVVFIKPTSF